MVADINSKIGNDRRGYEDMMREFGLGERNERGQRKLEFCQGKPLCITNNYFYHREQHRYTWTHPDGIHKNCNDYILINKKWRTLVMGMKVMRGADFGTSHKLLLAKIRIKFRTDRGKNQELVRYNVDEVKAEEVKTALKVRVGGRLEPLTGLKTTEKKWCQGRNIIRQEAESILVGHSRTLFTTVHRLTRGWKNNGIALSDADGNKLSATGDVEKIWKTHYEEQLKGSVRRVTEDDYPELRGELWNIQEIPDILIEELKKAVGAMSSGKAPEINGIPKELLGADGEMVERWLCDLCNDIEDG
ncbi:craniofacial development protein 2-like [Palaemon carinicauda]|uniref:craniofacial development protein 2-like n=1 Tax=Palaemon carinicauda TaxID=392227 RepID=UPI0035B5EDC2